MGLLKPIVSKSKVNLELPPSCIQFCPAYPNFFVIGTYNLQKDEADAPYDTNSEEKKSQSRNGTLLVYWTDGTEL